MTNVVCYDITQDSETFSSCSLERLSRKMEGYRVAFLTTQEQTDYNDLMSYGEAVVNGNQDYVADNPRISALNIVLGEM